MQVFKKDGTSLMLKDRIGGGGEGSIYITDEGCAKIYHKPSVASENLPKVVKLQSIYWQYAQKDDYKELSAHVLVPHHMLFDRLGRFVGFLMPCLPRDDNMVLISYLDYRQMRAGMFPWDIKTRAHIVRNITRYVAQLHTVSVLPIDLNDQNIFLHIHADKVEVFFIDTDSYQVERIPARVIAGDIAPPEFFDGMHLADERSMVYVLAVIIHRIIMDGFSPFQFVRHKDISPFEVKRKGYSPLRYSELRPPKGYPPMERLGVLKDILARAIDPDVSRRPSLSVLYATVEKWITSVDKL
ncbi:hypothetical protein GM182_07665 [bacterium 3DAC]|nr:hypothetical protein GM182_07665 [bacterium 3DAC]